MNILETTEKLKIFLNNQIHSLANNNPLIAFEPVIKSLKHQFDRWAYIVGIAWFWVLCVELLSGCLVSGQLRGV